MVYRDFKDLPGRTASDKAFEIAKNPKYDGYQRGLTSMTHKFFEKNSAGANTSGGAIKREIMWNQQLGNELQKSIIKRLET